MPKRDRRVVAAVVIASETKRAIRRASKDLSTAEIEFRLDLNRKNVGQLEESVKLQTQSLAEARQALAQAREAQAALEDLLDDRR